MKHQRCDVVPFLETEQSHTTTPDPNDTQQEKERDSTAIAVRTHFRSLLSNQLSVASHQTNGMKRINGISHSEIKGHRACQKIGIRTK